MARRESTSLSFPGSEELTVGSEGVPSSGVPISGRVRSQQHRLQRVDLVLIEGELRNKCKVV